MGRKCNVLHCLSDSRRIEDQGVTFHKMPTHSDLRPKWLSLCKIPEDRRNVKVIYVCSRHFLRADFCNFKGTKYMLKQGALPSVFPWTANQQKSTEAGATDNSPGGSTGEFDVMGTPQETTDKNNSQTKQEGEIIDESSGDDNNKIKSDNQNIVSIENEPVNISMNEKSFELKEEIFASKDQNKTEQQPVNVLQNDNESISFVPGTRIEANDFHDKWYPAKIIEVDYDEKEVFIHFEKCLNRGDEWIPMDSSRLRPLQTQKKKVEVYAVGEKCLATWSDTRKFPATIRRIVDGGNCVNFYNSL